MKQFRNTGPMHMRRVIGGLLSQSRILSTLAVAAGFLAASSAFANEINLVTGTSGSVSSGSFNGGTSPASASDGTAPDAVYRLIDTIPAGTGVFQPFLSYQRRDTENGVNTSLGGSGQGFLDDKRVPQWTHDVSYGSLGRVDLNLQPVSSGGYFAFELDANETGVGNPNRLLSIDDIRIFVTSGSPFAGLNNDNQVLDRISSNSGLVYAQNATYKQSNNSADYPNWVLIDASRRTEGSTSGSGSSDMIVLIPAFAGNATDLVTFYTRNGVHDTSGDDGSDAGFEEWRYLSGPAVPDGGSTLLLLGSALIPLGLLRARRESNKA